MLLYGWGNVSLPVHAPGCSSTWTFCLDRMGRDLSFGSWFLHCAELIVIPFFEQRLVLLIKAFLIVHTNVNYFACISNLPILVGSRGPKSTRRLADGRWVSLLSLARASLVQTREKKRIVDLLKKQDYRLTENSWEPITTHILQKTLKRKKRWGNVRHLGELL